MTILTKPSNEKNLEKLPLPLGVDGNDVAMLHGTRTLLSNHRPSAPSDIDNESMVFNRSEVSCAKTFLLFLISLTVMSLGVLGGYTLYRMYAPSRLERSYQHYHALCDIPYDNNTQPRFFMQSDKLEDAWRALLPRALVGDDSFGEIGDNFFREEIELDLTDDESYAKIEVPDFKDGRRGRFMHDFKENQSAIIDTTADRCFIMPLDRDTTLPPKSFMDLMQKMGTGYYNIDTDRVRKHYRVVTPAIGDLTLISERIANECYDMKVYMLESYVSGVFKRSAEPLSESGKFAEFMGKGIVEFDIVNIGDVDEFERQQKK